MDIFELIIKNIAYLRLFLATPVATFGMLCLKKNKAVHVLHIHETKVLNSHIEQEKKALRDKPTNLSICAHKSPSF